MPGRSPLTIAALAILLALARLPGASAEYATRSHKAGTQSYWRTYLGLEAGDPRDWKLDPADDQRRTGIVRSFRWPGPGYGVKWTFVPDGMDWTIVNQVAVYDPSVPEEYLNISSIQEFLVERGYTTRWLWVPVFGPPNDDSVQTFYTAVDLSAWVAGGGTYDFLGTYEFDNGASPRLPGVKLAVSQWAWDADRGWSLDEASLFTGEAVVRIEEAYAAHLEIDSLQDLLVDTGSTSQWLSNPTFAPVRSESLPIFPDATDLTAWGGGAGFPGALPLGGGFPPGFPGFGPRNGDIVPDPPPEDPYVIPAPGVLTLLLSGSLAAILLTRRKGGRVGSGEQGE